MKRSAKITFTLGIVLAIALLLGRWVYLCENFEQTDRSNPPFGVALYNHFDPRLYPGTWLNHPFKVVNPNDPKFDPLKFKYMDHRTEDLAAVFKRMFKPGDSRAYVEAVLVQSAGSKANTLTPEIVSYSWNYSDRFRGHWGNPDMLTVYVYALYDINGNLVGIDGLWGAFSQRPAFRFNAELLYQKLQKI